MYKNDGKDDRVKQLTQELLPLIWGVINHSLYGTICTSDRIRLFTEQHVFAVWDFMCLLKELHRRIVSTSAPWFPPKDAFSAHLISSILVEEEGDISEDGVQYACHFDIYIAAMEKMGADTRPIKKLLALLAGGADIHYALKQANLRPATQSFILTTFSFFELEAHELAAAFVYGREGITAPMFLPIVKQLENKMGAKNQEQFSTFLYYLKRHITLDATDHLPKAFTMLSNLIGNDEKKWQEAKQAATKALTARINFFTDIQQYIAMGHPSPRYRGQAAVRRAVNGGYK